MYLSIIESAQLLGAKRLDQQCLDQLGWWDKSVSLEFEISPEDYDKFEREMRKEYGEDITISLNKHERAALPD